MKFALGTKILNADDFKYLLSEPNKSGFTPFFHALKQANRELFTICMEIMLVALQTDFLSVDDFKILLINPNAAGFSPLHQAILSKDPDILNLYFASLMYRHENQMIFSQEEFKEIINHRNGLGYNVLHQACNTESFAIVEAVVNFIFKVDPENAATIIQDLMQQRVLGRLPEARGNEALTSKEARRNDALTINIYLASFLDRDNKNCAYNRHFHILDELISSSKHTPSRDRQRKDMQNRDMLRAESATGNQNSFFNSGGKDSRHSTSSSSSHRYKPY